MKERIRAIMETKGMTQQEFSQFLEMSPASLSSIFTGRTNPTLNIVESIKKKFDNINLEWLMFGKGTMFLTDDNNENEGQSSNDDNAGPELADVQNQNQGTTVTPFKNNAVFDSSRMQANREDIRSGSSNYNSQSFSDMKIFNNNTRKIKEIRIFYDDQTYESFVPKDRS